MTLLPSFLVFAFLLLLFCGLQLFPAYPNTARAPFSPSLSSPSSSLLLSVSISPISYAFRYPAGCWYPPSEEKLPKKPSSCLSSLAIAGPGSASSSAAQKDTPPTYSICILCVGWTVSLFFWGFFVFFWFWGFFFHTMGQSFWALPPFQINTNNEYCCSPSQGHREFVSPAVPLIPHSSSQASHRYLCGTCFRYSANI